MVQGVVARVNAVLPREETFVASFAVRTGPVPPWHPQLRVLRASRSFRLGSDVTAVVA
jgi:hypothetical protein